jgi:hypothetical protein
MVYIAGELYIHIIKHHNTAINVLYNGLTISLRINPLTPNDAVSSLKIKISSKICMKDQQIHQLYIQFINHEW